MTDETRCIVRCFIAALLTVLTPAALGVAMAIGYPVTKALLMLVMNGVLIFELVHGGT